jgi:hypothetical protein
LPHSGRLRPQMGGILYTVIATLPNEAIRAEYIAWLEDGHLDQVVKGGAHTAMIARVVEPPSPPQVETQYIFSTHELFERYLRDSAPKLREEGLRRFGPARGVRFERRVGEIV